MLRVLWTVSLSALSLSSAGIYRFTNETNGEQLALAASVPASEWSTKRVTAKAWLESIERVSAVCWSERADRRGAFAARSKPMGMVLVATDVCIWTFVYRRFLRQPIGDIHTGGRMSDLEKHSTRSGSIETARRAWRSELGAARRRLGLRRIVQGFAAALSVWGRADRRPHLDRSSTL